MYIYIYINSFNKYIGNIHEDIIRNAVDVVYSVFTVRASLVDHDLKALHKDSVLQSS